MSYSFSVKFIISNFDECYQQVLNWFEDDSWHRLQHIIGWQIQHISYYQKN